jgi:hypothetical protein
MITINDNKTSCKCMEKLFVIPVEGSKNTHCSLLLFTILKIDINVSAINIKTL